MKRRRNLTEINAGSMADIAFLLLIFFLVTTTLEVDQGIFSRIAKETPSDLQLKRRNLLAIYINKNDEILINDDVIPLKNLISIATDFIDNGAGKDLEGRVCAYCNGKKLALSSEHPTKAVITIEADRAATYETYVLTVDKIHKAYNDLRNQFALKKFNTSYKELEAVYTKTHDTNVFEKIELIKSKYPMLLGNIEKESAMANK
jgi:biopolymer transport protein ExbD